jgi:hypothetical protein
MSPTPSPLPTNIGELSPAEFGNIIASVAEMKERIDDEKLLSVLAVDHESCVFTPPYSAESSAFWQS